MTGHKDCGGYLFPSSDVPVRPISPTLRPDLVDQALAFAAVLRDGKRRSSKKIDLLRRWSALEVLEVSPEFQDFLELAGADPARSWQTPAQVAELVLGMIRALIAIDPRRVTNCGPTKHENEAFEPAQLRISPLDSAPGAPRFAPLESNSTRGI